MTKKGEKGTYHKPKPRVAVYAGVAIGIGRLGGDQGRVEDVLIAAKGDRLNTLRAAALSTSQEPGRNAIDGGVPAAVGVLASVAADKLGVNKVLAKMKFPVRV